MAEVEWTNEALEELKLKIEESEVMKEIREIRRKQYEETKDLPPTEQIAYDIRLSDEFEKESGIVLRRLSKSS